MMPTFVGRDLRVSPATKLVFKLALHQRIAAQPRAALMVVANRLDAPAPLVGCNPT